jgi:DNA mismatch repair protein MutH
MIIVTRTIAIENLKKYIDKDLRELAQKLGITTYETGRQNKGWKGLVLERLAGLTNNSKKAPNGLSWELKSVAFHYVQGVLKPKETMAITMINQDELLRDSFYDSHCWAKLKSIILCSVMWHGRNAEAAELLGVASFDFLQDSEVLREIEEDYEFIRNKLRTQGFVSLTGSDGKWIQARTKGAGHGSTSRAFYARPNLVKLIYESGIK